MWKPSQQKPGDSGKLLRFSLILAVVLMSLWFAVTLTTNPAKDKATLNLGPDKESIHTPTEDRVAGIALAERSPAEPRAGQDESRFGNSGVVMAFILMAGLLGVGFWTYRKHRPESGVAKGVVSIREQIQVATGHQITLLEINNEVWVLGLSGTQMNLLHRYAKGEWCPDTPLQQQPDHVSVASAAGPDGSKPAEKRQRISSDNRHLEPVASGFGDASDATGFYMDLIRKNGFQFK